MCKWNSGLGFSCEWTCRLIRKVRRSGNAAEVEFRRVEPYGRKDTLRRGFNGGGGRIPFIKSQESSLPLLLRYVHLFYYLLKRTGVARADLLQNETRQRSWVSRIATSLNLDHSILEWIPRTTKFRYFEFDSLARFLVGSLNLLISGTRNYWIHNELKNLDFLYKNDNPIWIYGLPPDHRRVFQDLVQPPAQNTFGETRADQFRER